MKFPYLPVLISIVLFVATCQASSDSEPHPHEGKVTPFLPGDPKVPLTEEALEILKSGKAYNTQIQSGSSGRGLVVQDVHAPTDIVWERILDFDHYAEMVPKTVSSSNYHEVQNPKDDHQTIYTQMQVGFPMIKLQFFIRHEYYPESNSLTWTLDYTRKSDLDDSCGYWYVVPHPDKPKEWSRVFYSVDVSMFDWVPSLVVNFMSRQALTVATGWVKKFSELEFAKRPIVSDDEEPVTQETKKQQKKLQRSRWLGGKLEKETEKNDDDTVSTPETCDSDEEEFSDTTSTNEIAPIGMTRYALVSLILCLGMYNIHLFFSQ